MKNIKADINMDLNFKRKNNFLDYKKYIFEQRTEKEIKSIAISWQQDLIAIGSIGNAYVYNYSDVLKRESLDANLWLKLKRRSAAILDWNNDLDYILATACQTNCTIFDCNYNREICTFDVSNSITSLAWSKKNNAFLAYSTYDNTIWIRDTDEGRNAQAFETGSRIDKIAFSYTHEHLLSSSHDDGINLWDIRNGGKIPLKSYKLSEFKWLNLEFDKEYGLLLGCSK